MKKNTKYQNLLIRSLHHNNEEEFFYILFNEFCKYIGSIAISYSLDTALEPDDVIQEVFLKLKKSGGIALFNEEQLPTIKSFLGTVTRNVCHNMWKRNLAKITLAKAYEEDQLGKDDFEASETEYFSFSEKMQIAISKLSLKQKNIFNMRINGYKYWEIAQILEIKESNVKYHFKKARDLLKESLCDPLHHKIYKKNNGI